MHFATLNHVHIMRNPDFNIAAEITFDQKGAVRLQLLKMLAFGPAGETCSDLLSL